MNFELPILHSPRVSLFVFQIKDLVDIYPCITKTLTRYMSWEPAENFQALEQIGQQWILAESKNTDSSLYSYFYWTDWRTSRSYNYT